MRCSCRWRVRVVGVVQGFKGRDLRRPAGIEFLDQESLVRCRDDGRVQHRQVGWIAQAQAGTPFFADNDVTRLGQVLQAWIVELDYLDICVHEAHGRAIISRSLSRSRRYCAACSRKSLRPVSAAR